MTFSLPAQPKRVPPRKDFEVGRGDPLHAIANTSQMKTLLIPTLLGGLAGGFLARPATRGDWRAFLYPAPPTPSLPGSQRPAVVANRLGSIHGGGWPPIFPRIGAKRLQYVVLNARERQDHLGRFCRFTFPLRPNQGGTVAYPSPLD